MIINHNLANLPDRGLLRLGVRAEPGYVYRVNVTLRNAVKTAGAAIVGPFIVAQNVSCAQASGPTEIWHNAGISVEYLADVYLFLCVYGYASGTVTATVDPYRVYCCIEQRIDSLGHYLLPYSTHPVSRVVAPPPGSQICKSNGVLSIGAANFVAGLEVPVIPGADIVAASDNDVVTFWTST